jgi:biotin carboxyl carrier protein
MRRVRLIYRGPDGPETLEVEADGWRCALKRGNEIEHAELARLPDGRVSLLFESGRQICGRLGEAAQGEVELSTRGKIRRLSLAEPLRDRLAHAGEHGSGQAADEEIRAQMPGRVVEVAVSAGDRVEARSLLLVLEAMKMQNEIRTVRGGLVTRVAVEAGKAVEGGALLAVVRQDAIGVVRQDAIGVVRQESTTPPSIQ